MRTGAFLLIMGLAACGGKDSDVKEPGPSNETDVKPSNEGVSDPAAVYGPLEKGADYKSWTKLNTAPVKSKTHGGRYVDTYVNPEGVEAYKNDDADIPVGTVIVKPSWEAGADGPTDVAGPTFVMARVAGDDGEPTWWYGFHWEKVPESWQPKLGGASQIYWRTPSKKVDYCSGCHDNYPRELGGIPKDKRSW